MIKKFILIVIIFVLGQSVFAKSIPVQIKPVEKISTAGSKVQEGDVVDFVVLNDVYQGSKLYIKSGEKVSGTITNLKQNNFLYEPAEIYIEDFLTKDSAEKPVKLDGVIYKKGNDFGMITQFIPFPCFALKGGQARLRPNKDVFTLYLESKND